jgi:wyosine [tRNA(Phe)-imidazoG37] synthetase (radical SAM superfamily)
MEVLHPEVRHEAHSELAPITVYGPVPSRRYGVTLGVNLLPPGEKYCTFRCTYCQLGPEKHHADAHDYPDLATLERELTAALRDGPALDALVVSGNGEPTLHPQLAEALGIIARVRDAYLPGRAIVVLTAGTELHRPEVRAALLQVDEVAVKLDAGTQATFEKLDMPWQPLRLDDLTAAAALLPSPAIQTILVRGRVDNTTEVEVTAWLQRIQQIQPRRVDLYTLDRKPIDKKLERVPLEVAQQIAQKVEALGIACRVFAGI